MKILCLILVLCCSLSATAQSGVSIVTSIEPLALIGKAVVGERGRVISLVDPKLSPHEYSMRPSDRIAIQQANLLIWVDRSFEMYLEDIFRAQEESKALITFSSLPDVILAHEESGELDPHLWLNSKNAALLAQAIAIQASMLDRENEAYFLENLEIFRAELVATERNISSLFLEPTENNYAVYHNAYRYFEDQFGLQAAIVLLRNTESQPGIQEILRVRTSIQELQPRCLFIEIDANIAIIQTMLGGIELEMPVVDTLGYNVASDASGYLAMMRALAEQFRQCIY